MKKAQASPWPTIDAISRLHVHMDDAQLEFLKLEYGNLTQALLNNEELGERRFNILVGLIGAGTAGVALAADTLKADQTLFLGSVAALTAGLLLFGLATLRRVMQRNLASTEFLNGIALIRATFIARAPSAAELFPYVPDGISAVRTQKGWGLGKAGLLETVALANCALVIVCSIAVLVGVGLPLVSAAAIGVAAAIGAWFEQLLWAGRTYPGDTARRNDGRAKGIEAWRSSMNETGETFRAGVGMAVVGSDGKVLVLERRDTPGAWQLPQGGLDLGESPVDAAWRELREEVGLTADHIVLETATDAWFGYELPSEYRKPKTGRGQVHLWFRFRVRDGVELPELPSGEGAEFQARRSVAPGDAVSEAVEFRRAEYRSALGALGLL